MKVIFLYVILLTYKVFGEYREISSRHKRGTSGVLDIITNHAQPIHADVKHENTGLTEKPCPKTYVINLPSNIESGIVFQVTPPRDIIYDGRSLRKSLPLTTKLDFVRAVSRVVTLITLLFSAVVEFYPLVQQLYNMMYDYINYNKY